MAVSKKRSPYVKLENRAFQQVYDDLNDVIDNVNQYIDIKSSKSVIGDLVPNEDLSYNLGDENNSFKNVYAEKFYGDGSALTGVSGGGGGASFITAGTATPSTTNVADKTPSIGDVYIQYPSNYVSDGNNNQNTGLSTSPKIYVRVSDEAVLKMYYHNGSYYKCQEHVDNGYTEPTPKATSIVFCNADGNTFSSSYYLVGRNINAYAKCEYNSDVSGGVDDGTPQADFSVGINKDFDTADNTRTSSPNNEFQNITRDNYLSVNWVANGATEGGIAVGSSISQSKKLYAKNNKLWGSTNVDFPTASLADIENVLNNVAESQQQGSGTNYSNFGDKIIENESFDRIFFAIPNGVSDISSILNSDSNFDTPLLTSFDTINQVGGSTIDYTNAEGYTENYKIWYSDQQGASTITWRVS